MRRWTKQSITLLLPLLLTILTALQAAAQMPVAAAAAEEVQMADALRQSGKIYVVVAAVTIIVLGLLLYIFALDRKVSRLEKQLNP